MTYSMVAPHMSTDHDRVSLEALQGYAPTVIVALSLISSASCAPALIVIVYNLFRRKKKGHEWPKLKIISASKV